MTGAVRWTGGLVFTGARYAEALLIDDGRIVAVGDDASVRRVSPTGTEHRPLDGRTIVPGLIDAHLHLGEIARYRAGLDLAPVRSLEELTARLAEWVEQRPSGPIVGRGFDLERGGDERWPTALVLDGVVRDRPVLLYHASGHAAVANSAALEEAGIDPAASVGDDPTVGHGPDGRPDGRLVEGALRRIAPIADRGSPVGGPELAAAAQALAVQGITAVGTVASPPEERIELTALARAGRLPIAVRAYRRLGDPAGERPSADPTARFDLVGVKGFLDGAFGPRTAELEAPYDDAPESRGLAVGDDAEIASALDAAVADGLAPALHAIGDRAIARAVRLLTPFAGRTARPLRIEHAGVTPPALFPALEALRPTLVVQPGFVWSDGWLADRLGAGRARWAYAFRTLRARGIPLAGSTDAPFDPVDVWRGLRASVQRLAPDGRSANRTPGEALPVEEAVRLFTGDAAAALGLTDRGELRPGAAADLVVVRPGGLAAAVLGPGAPVEEVWVDGRPVPALPA